MVTNWPLKKQTTPLFSPCAPSVRKTKVHYPRLRSGHNIVILKEGVSAIAFGGKALQSGANATNALPDAVKADVFAYSQLLGPGESEIVKFIAPVKPGIHQFVCTFPGHYAMMRGVMVVK